MVRVQLHAMGGEGAVGLAVGAVGVGRRARATRDVRGRAVRAGKVAVGHGLADVARGGAVRARLALVAVDRARHARAKARRARLAAVRAAVGDAREAHGREFGVGVAVKAAAVAHVEAPGDVVRARIGDRERGIADDERAGRVARAQRGRDELAVGLVRDDKLQEDVAPVPVRARDGHGQVEVDCALIVGKRLDRVEVRVHRLPEVVARVDRRAAREPAPGVAVAQARRLEDGRERGPVGYLDHVGRGRARGARVARAAVRGLARRAGAAHAVLEHKALVARARQLRLHRRRRDRGRVGWVARLDHARHDVLDHGLLVELAVGLARLVAHKVVAHGAGRQRRALGAVGEGVLVRAARRARAHATVARDLIVVALLARRVALALAERARRALGALLREGLGAKQLDRLDRRAVFAERDAVVLVVCPAELVRAGRDVEAHGLPRERGRDERHDKHIADVEAQAIARQRRAAVLGVDAEGKLDVVARVAHKLRHEIKARVDVVEAGHVGRGDVGAVRVPHVAVGAGAVGAERQRHSVPARVQVCAADAVRAGLAGGTGGRPEGQARAGVALDVARQVGDGRRQRRGVGRLARPRVEVDADARLRRLVAGEVRVADVVGGARVEVGARDRREDGEGGRDEGGDDGDRAHAG
eukprot:Unigene2611_Nuclearia_a/m.8069 Unigene2611_Nuclearia_a/g.8069  ORF Unigene2611_Nuclearia_a/g.8069 Unigene2611_Nuclearia_a/m.8069 type:complete len:647 (+) Unigene2611_Nuclearia_a:1280-3220(+)